MSAATSPPIAPHVSGFVAQVLVTDNQLVQAGQLLIRLDRRDYQAALDHAEAVVAARAAALDRLRAQYVLQQSTIRQQEADLAAQSGAGELRRARTPPATAAWRRPPPARARTRSAPTRWTQQAQRRGARRRRRRWKPRSQQLKVLDAQIAEAEADRGAGAGRPADRAAQSRTTPRSARRSTAMSAIAPPRSAPT